MADRGEGWLRKEEYGQVPQYILERKLCMAAQYAEELVSPDQHALPTSGLVIRCAGACIYTARFA